MYLVINTNFLGCNSFHLKSHPKVCLNGACSLCKFWVYICDIRKGEGEGRADLPYGRSDVHRPSAVREVVFSGVSLLFNGALSYIGLQGHRMYI